MIIIKAQGGLGNQMFQYALYRVFELKNKNVKMDISSSTLNLHTGFELQRIFNIKINYSSYEESFHELSNVYINEEENEWIYNYEPEILKINHGYLDGYWQHEEYFNEIRDELLKLYKFNNVDSYEINKVLDKINNTESVSIHVRRGDYINSVLYENIATIEYYTEAISIIKNKVKNPVFFIFSDDIEWVKKNLNLEKAYIVDFNIGQDSYKDMFLMSKCKHNIIANSTFSWWGAWLNSYYKKIVIRPYKFINIEMEESNLCDVKGWIKCGEQKSKKNLILKHKECNYYEKAKFTFLYDLFTKKKYDDIIKFGENGSRSLAYFKFRINIIKNNYEEAIKEYHSLLECINNNFDDDIYISALFHFGEYMYKYREYNKAREAFEKLNEITNGQHKKAEEYLKLINKLKE